MDSSNENANSHRVAVRDLHLDSRNPRLPIGSESWGQEQIFEFIRAEYGIDDLVSSMTENGYFEQEPLLVVQEDERLIVVEGNRRLCALKSIHGEFGDADSSLELFTAAAAGRLTEVPVVLVLNRDSINTYLGYRHISGLKTWRPEAKARFVAQQVQKSIDDDDPFKSVGRMIGSNSAGVRSFYRAYQLLDHARNETAKSDAAYVFRNKFGVWTRLLNSSGYRKYINLQDGVTKSEVDTAILNVNIDRLAETLSDLVPSDDRRPALLHDSREASDYGNALANPFANSVLRQTNSISLATSVVNAASVAANLDEMADTLEQTRKLIESSEPVVIGDIAKVDKAVRRLENEVNYLRIQVNSLKKNPKNGSS